MVVRNPILISKEDVNFREALKLYDGKQYKKALKLVEQTLKKNSNHAELLALKGCINHHTGHPADAEPYILKATAKSGTNYLVCHLAGIYYRAVENYSEAAKWLKAANDNGLPNKPILRDLSLMQTQIRDYKNLRDSRQAYLESQPGYRANWTAVAVAHHLNKDYRSAVATLTKIEGIIKDHLQESDRYEQLECVLYKNAIISESGDHAKALETLENDDPEIRDKLSVLEYKAKYLLLLGRSEEASVVYRRLLQRNPDNVSYYHLLETALGTSSKPVELRLKLYEKLAHFYPRSDPPRFLPLTFLPASHPAFVEVALAYILPQLKRGVPATFVNVKPLYKNLAKLAAIGSIVMDFLANEAPKMIPTVTVWTKYFLAQHYLYMKDLTKASAFIDEALAHSPTLVELYVVKARILKHLGKPQEASDVMNEGRSLDLQDRFINSKATKYLLRANKVDEAIDCISLFTKLDEDSPNGCKDLHTMQANWVLVESAEAYARLAKEYEAKLKALAVTDALEETAAVEADLLDHVDLYRGLAMKRFNAIIKVFKTFYLDQFDFHSYCMRKGTPRDYIDTLRWEDKLHATPIYVRVVKGLAALELELYEQQKRNGAEESNDTKKNGSKKNKKTQVKNVKKKADLIARVEAVKEDPDPLGAKLLADTLGNVDGDILDKLHELVKPLTVEADKYVTTWSLAFEVNRLTGKYILALQALKSLNRLLNSTGELKLKVIGDKVLSLLSTARNDDKSNPAIIKVAEKGLMSAFPELADETEFAKVYVQ